MKATWPAIVSKDDFDSAQSLLGEAKKLERVRLEGAEERFYVLSGILRCSQCGSPMVGQAAHGEKQVHRYYGHTNAFRNTECEFHRLPAQEVETAVLEYIWSAIKDAGYIERIEKNLREMRNVKSLNVARERRSMKDQLNTIQAKIDGLLLMQGQATSAEAIKFAMKTFEALSTEKADLEGRLDRLNSNSDEEAVIRESIDLIEENLRGFERGYTKAKGSMKKRLLKKVLKQVVMTPEGIYIFMQLADGVEIPNHKIKLIRFEDREGQKKAPFAITQKASGDDSNLLVLRSDNNINGDACRIRTYDLFLRRELLYPAELRHQCENRDWNENPTCNFRRQKSSPSLRDAAFGSKR